MEKTTQKQLVFSVTKKDLEFQFFRAGGKGGQKQNKTSSGARVIHRESGAVGECRNNRSQFQNKVEAFRRMAASPRFKSWARRVSHEIMSGKTIEQKVDESVVECNLLIEYRAEDGTWRREPNG